ncbi:MAG: hypothetical protein AB1442_03370 [Nitrospirota bacterium]
MDESSSKNLLMQLIAARSENEVRKVIESDRLLASEENWKPYGGYESNFNTINNQAKNSVAALAEKPINSIDALLLKECKLRGINPESKQAPKTMKEAVGLFCGIKSGDFSDVADRERRKIAENIRIIAEGDKKRPNIIISDTGEGQHPDDFENTFLSLHRGNKNKIMFVQGKYNMGGSGVLPNCGEHNYQLILSRKTPELLKKGQKDLWGFTLVRLHVATSAEYKNSWYEYFVCQNGKIASFAGEPLPVLPENVPLESGTCIKLYNYYLPNPSQITLDLWRDLNRVLHFPVLPMTLHETRKFKGHSPSKILVGNKMRILKDDSKSVEDNCPPIIPIIAELGKFGKRTIEVTVFKEGTVKDEFASPGESVFFTINGQTHAAIGRSFLRTKANLHYLADYTLVHIDCTDVDTNIREKIFMPSRDRMRDTEISKEIELILAEELSRHEGLRQLNQFRREQQITKNPKDAKFLEGVVSKLIKKNRTILHYLGIGGNIRDIGEAGVKDVKAFEGERIPTYLKIIGPDRKRMPINAYSRVAFETDAENDYFSRETDPGSFIIYPDVMKSCHLWNGRITAKIIPSKTARVGAVRRIIALLTRPYDEPLSVEFEVEYTPAVEPEMKPHLPKSPKVKAYKLPEPILVYKNKRAGYRSWEEIKKEDGTTWNGEDIAKVVPSGNGAGVDVYINMDADALRNFLRQQKVTDKRQDFVKRSWETAIFLNSMVIFNDLAKTERGEMVSDVMKSISKIILDLMCNDTFLKELEKGDQ